MTRKLIQKNFGKNGKFLNNKNLNQIKKAQKNSFIQVLKRKIYQLESLN